MESAIARNVKRIISERGLKQGVTGEKAGYNAKTFNNMLNGRKLITAEDVLALCKILNVSPNDLFGVNEGKSA